MIPMHPEVGEQYEAIITNQSYSVMISIVVRKGAEPKIDDINETVQAAVKSVQRQMTSQEFEGRI